MSSFFNKDCPGSVCMAQNRKSRPAERLRTNVTERLQKLQTPSNSISVPGEVLSGPMVAVDAQATFVWELSRRRTIAPSYTTSHQRCTLGIGTSCAAQRYCGSSHQRSIEPYKTAIIVEVDP